MRWRSWSKTSNGSPGDQIQGTEFSLSLVIIIGAFAFIGAMLIIHFITLYSVITTKFASITDRNLTAVKDLITSVDSSNQTIFNILLPVFGAWVGVVVAFYFGNEQNKRAQQALVKAYSPEEEKLSTVKVQTLLETFPETQGEKNIHKVTLGNTLGEVISAFAGLSDVLVVGKDDDPLGIVYKSDLLEKIPCSLENGKIPDTVKADDGKALSGMNLGDFLRNPKYEIQHEFITNWRWDPDKGIKNYATVEPNDNLLQARNKMYNVSSKVNDVRCVVVQPSTKKAIGIFSYDSISWFMK
jgi:hypothetical protein